MARPQAEADPFRAIADPTRRAIIELLSERPHTAGELANSFTTCQSTVSEHLGILRRAGLVSYTEQASRRIYTLTPASLAEVATWSARYVRLPESTRRGQPPMMPQAREGAPSRGARSTISGRPDQTA